MRAAYYESKGPAWSVLKVGELPDPEPGPGELRVRIHVSGVNPSDTKSRGGWTGDMSMPWPRIVPHQDGAGVVDRVGPGVPSRRVGERVWIYEAQWNSPFGTAAEYAVVPAANAVPLPDDVGFETGASLGIPAMTAHRCLFADGGIQGQTVLVAGGGGAVGEAAIHLASWAGARVIATVSRPEQESVARAAGAHHVVNRRHTDVAAAVSELTRGQGVHRVVEVAFEENLEIDRAVLRPNGVIATYASGGPDSTPEIPFRALMWRAITVHFVLVYVMPVEAHRVAARDIGAALASGRYRPHVGRRFPLEDVAEAHRAQESGQVVGKILVDVVHP
jgi:NADPH2:quinone reductase